VTYAVFSRRGMYKFHYELWGFCCDQNNLLDKWFLSQITSAPWYVSNISLHDDLKINTVKNYWKNIHIYKKKKKKTTQELNSLRSNILRKTVLGYGQTFLIRKLRNETKEYPVYITPLRTGNPVWKCLHLLCIRY